MKKYIIIATLTLVIGFIRYRSRDNYRYAINEGHGLFIEVYKSGLAGNFKSEYLTDFANFRIYLGTYDEDNEHIKTEFTGDQIKVEKSVDTSSMDEWNWQKVVERKTYSLEDLKKRRVFE